MIPIGDYDTVLGFTLPDKGARGRCVRLSEAARQVLDAHDYPPPIRNLLAEALVLACLMGSLIKGRNGQMTMQAQAQEAVVELLVADYRNGELRGYVKHDPERLGDIGANASLMALFGSDGHLAVTFDVEEAGGHRYQGIVPLQGDSLSAACQSYFERSEQIPTNLQVAVQTDEQMTVAGGLLLQHLPEGEEGRERLHVQLDHPDWEHVDILAQSLKHSELVDPALELRALVWRLFHEEPEIRVETINNVERGCRCTPDHFRDVLTRFPDSDIEEMKESDGLIHVDCAFCSRIFGIEI